MKNLLKKKRKKKDFRLVFKLVRKKVTNLFNATRDGLGYDASITKIRSRKKRAG